MSRKPQENILSDNKISTFSSSFLPQSHNNRIACGACYSMGRYPAINRTDISISFLELLIFMYTVCFLVLYLINKIKQLSVTVCFGMIPFFVFFLLGILKKDTKMSLTSGQCDEDAMWSVCSVSGRIWSGAMAICISL